MECGYLRIYIVVEYLPGPDGSLVGPATIRHRCY